MTKADEKFERHICEELLKISKDVYAANSSEIYPSAEEVMAKKVGVAHSEVRDEIQENLDFIRVSLKYMTFDIAAMGREIEELKNRKKGKS